MVITLEIASRWPVESQIAAPVNGDISRWICKRLLIIRKEKGLSQRTVAKAVPCVRTYITKYERGLCKPTIKQLQKLASALGVALEQLLDESISAEDLATQTRHLGGSGDGELIAEIYKSMPRLGEFVKNLLLRAAKDLAVKRQGTFEDWIVVK
jgi:transcriptional regulator with XRE-family HTH domain